jgi:hypothetical protein
VLDTDKPETVTLLPVSKRSMGLNAAMAVVQLRHNQPHKLSVDGVTWLVSTELNQDETLKVLALSLSDSNSRIGLILPATEWNRRRVGRRRDSTAITQRTSNRRSHHRIASGPPVSVLRTRIRNNSLQK